MVAVSLVAQLPVVRSGADGSTVQVLRAGLAAQAGDLVVAVVSTRVPFDEAAVSGGWGVIGRWQSWGRLDSPFASPSGAQQYGGWMPTTFRDSVLDQDIVVGKLLTAADVVASNAAWPVSTLMPRPAIEDDSGAVPVEAAWLFRGERSAPDIAESAVLSRDPVDVTEARSGAGSLEVRTVFPAPYEVMPAGGMRELVVELKPFPDGVLARAASRVVVGSTAAATYPVWVQDVYNSTWPLSGLYYTVARRVTTSMLDPTPLRPRIIDPRTPAFVDVEAEDWPVAWVHDPGMAGAQVKYRLRRTTGSTVTYWDHASQTWVPGVTDNTSTVKSTSIKAGSILNGETFTLEVATQGAGFATWSPWSTPVTVTGAPRPTAAVVIVERDPVTGLVRDATPTVVVTGAPAAGLSITGWEVRLWHGPVGTGVLEQQTSGVATAPWTPRALVDGQAYTLQARAQQTGGAWSAWVDLPFTVDVPTPAAPTVTADPTWTHEISGVPGVLVTSDFAWAGQDFGFDAPARVRVHRRVDGGPWAGVGLTDYRLGISTWELIDYAAPAGGQVEYRSRAEVRFDDGGESIGPWGYSDPVAAPDMVGGWLVDIERPETAVHLRLAEDDARERDLRSSAIAAIGRSDWTVALGVPMHDTGKMTAATNEATEQQRLVDLLLAGGLLVLRMCHERSGSDGSWSRGEVIWMRVAGGSVSTSRTSGGPFQRRQVSWPWVAQPAPKVD